MLSLILKCPLGSAVVLVIAKAAWAGGPAVLLHTRIKAYPR